MSAPADPGAAPPPHAAAADRQTPPQGTPERTRDPVKTGAIDRSRYRRVRRYIVRLFLHALWHDLFLTLPVLRGLRSDPRERWPELARQFRDLAVELGGVLIKLGQFLSTRVDVLPIEIIRELSGLQDRVPAAPFDGVAERIETDFGLPLSALFLEVDPVPVGAASLAQAHRARLRDGEPVVVKVLRPGIETLVETDLAAVHLAVRWLRPWRQIRRWVDLDRLYQELSATTRAELDLEREATAAERFAEMFADDPGIRAPRVHHERSARHTLTLEDVGFLRISDHAALDAAGVSRPEVARKLYGAYMEQLFVHHYVHCDPHPGNLFVRPLGPDEPPDEGRGTAGAPSWERGRPFELVFVDFGMMTAVPEPLWEAMGEVLIALGTRDARRLVRAYRDAGILLPGTDLDRMEELHRSFFDRLWGVKLGHLQEVAIAEARGFFLEYRDLLYQAPFQFPVDLLFVFRAVGLLAGLATSLDREFDPWAETLPFAERMARSTPGEAVRRGLDEVGELARLALRLPRDVERVLERAQGEGLAVEVHLSGATRRELRRLGRSGTRVGWMIAAAALFLGGVQVDLARPEAAAPVWMWGAAAACVLWALLRR